ncbi:hypothetical protein HMPREF9470_05594 [[Clostridium] citroniae WAL-19142]|uniref:ABC-type oligopeptide transport system substrate-binding subunit n=2 Tax=Enterocloster citroniae TaxID=358743 RepID=A0ABV2G692_9FIRM|nr:hypothetical protein HMPREF9470_05594 [[Clostridium] citroniae WAL-19142]
MIKKKNMNRILPAMLALLLCLSLVACGGDSKNAESTKRTKTGKESQTLLRVTPTEVRVKVHAMRTL